MPKGGYIGVNNVAHRIKAGYVGVGGVARRIKKAYIGVGGIARLIWNADEPAYFGTSSLSAARHGLAATHVGNYALFGGGIEYLDGYKEKRSTQIDVYNSSMTHSSNISLNNGINRHAATHVGDRAIFAGGLHDNVFDETGYETSRMIEAYRSSDLVKTTMASGMTNPRCDFAATHVGNYALLAGGAAPEDDKVYNTIEAYNINLAKFTPSSGLSVARSDLAATHVGDYALFAGGWADTWVANVDAYSSSLTKTSVSNLSVARYAVGAAHVGDYALFGDGIGSYTGSVMDVYNKSLTRSGISGVSVKRDSFATASTTKYAFFGGGCDDNSADESAVVDVYDSSLSRTTIASLSKARWSLSATHNGSYVIFAGGYANAEPSAVVDVYVIPE